jgi:DNA-binding response OmpR family regulator
VRDTPAIQNQVLLIEDDAWIRSFLRDVLTDAGYLVSEAADGETGLRMLREQRPDVVLLDLAMPDVTGVEVLRRLRSDRLSRDIPVLVISAYTRVLPPDQVDLASGVLRKPLDVDNLLAEVRRVLGTRPNS